MSNPESRVRFLRQIHKIHLATGRPLKEILSSFLNIFSKLLENPQIAELLRFIFLGTVVEASRVVGQRIVDVITKFFVVKATFHIEDFAYDWLKCYLDSRHIWDESRCYSVAAKNPSEIPNNATKLGEKDGHPDPVFEPAPESPELFRWKGYWLSITKDERSSALVLKLWSRNRKPLDDFVLEAREHYIHSPLPPRIIDYNYSHNNQVLKARFNQSDWSFEWILSYLRERNAFNDAVKFTISTKQSDLAWGKGPKDAVRYVPAGEKDHMFQFDSKMTGKKIWVQASISHGSEDYRGRVTGGAIDIIIHTSHKSVLGEFIDEARNQYTNNSMSRVTVHLCDRYGDWGKVVTKSRRALSTLVLPGGVKELLLDDMLEFLDSEEWYVRAGVPHRRGYLLYGDPGTGKSSTIHAMAGELGLEIYCISLGSPGIDDHNLAKLISDTPSRSILLLEDIDCAFPSRDAENDDEEYDQEGNPMPRQNAPRSEVTLAGLLNVLDSVTSEEGRITFATTNHIEDLDPALIRPGRMDVKIQYTLATSAQIEETFSRFFPEEIFGPSVSESTFQDLNPKSSYVASTHRKRLRLCPNRSYSISELNELAKKFAGLVPEYKYSIAQLQGYLLTKKLDPVAAIDALPDWLKAQDEEKAKVEELRAKRRLEAAKRRKEAKELDKMLNSDADSNVKERRESQKDSDPDPAEPITPPSEQTESNA